MNRLPHEIEMYILGYLISFDSIVFKDNDISNYHETCTNYHPRYKVAFYEKGRLFNGKYLLSRIEKPNGNHRYYFTKEIINVYCSDCSYNRKLTGNMLPNIHLSSLSDIIVSPKIKEYCSRYCSGSLDFTSKYSSVYVGNKKKLFDIFVIYLSLQA
jgi:hypothetical protein